MVVLLAPPWRGSVASKVFLAMTLLVTVLLAGCWGKKDIRHFTFSGTLEMTEHVLGAKVAGRLTSLNVDEGSRVKKGELLATFDRYDQTKKDLMRQQGLYETGGANLQSLENAKLAMEDQEIIAPQDGLVLVKTAETGEIIPAGGGVLVVGDPLQVWIKIFVAEDLMHAVRLNMPATISIDGTNKKYRGHVSFIADKAEFSPRNVQTPDERVTQTFGVKVMVDDADGYLHTGVAADVRFH